MIIKNANVISYGIQNGIYDILIESGKIKKIEKKIEENGEEILDIKNMYITAGLVDAHTHLGLKANGLGEFYADHNEKKNMIAPYLRAIDGINPQDITFKEARNSGVTACGTGPGSANVVGGQYACIKTYGDVIDEMILNPYFAMKVALGENPKKIYDTTRMGIASALREFLIECKNYAEKHDKYDKRLEPMIPIMRKEKYLKIHVHQALDIATAIRICEEFDLKYTLDHVTSGLEIINFLNTKKNIPLLLGPSLGNRSKVELLGKNFDDMVKVAQNRDVCLITDSPVIPLQYLALCAGIAISKGMPYDKAIEAVTINPARVMDVDDRIGSIEIGKDADLVIWKEKPLIFIQDPEYVFINGKVVFQKGMS